MILKHKHHILPIRLGGTDDQSNIIELTIEEHAEAHRILWETYHEFGDFMAWQMLSGKTDEKEKMRIELSKHGFQSFLQNEDKKNKWRKKISNSLTGKKQTAETKKKRSETLKKRYLIDSNKDRFRIKHGRTPSKELQRKMAEGRKKSKRWHEAVRSKESENRKRNSSKRRIEVIIDGIRFLSIRQACKDSNKSPNYIYKVFKGLERDDNITFFKPFK